jgi:carbonyl reductase 1
MTRIALVTGANQGIGFALVEGLAARLDPDDLVLLTGRNAQRVADATASVSGAHARVEGRVLDVRDTAAIARLANELGGVDIVLSNAIAPFTPDRPQAEQADEFIDVSNVATHAILRSFGPVLRPGGRLIVVASSLGTLDHLDPELHPLFDGVSLDEVEQTVESWRAAIHNGTTKEQCWPDWINVPSKIAQVAAVRAYAAQRRDKDLAEGTLVASVCPGLVDTRASRPWFYDFSYALTPTESARRVLDFVLSDLDPATYGELVRFGKVLPWIRSEPRP